jgi:hypothetical protein
MFWIILEFRTVDEVGIRAVCKTPRGTDIVSPRYIAQKDVATYLRILFACVAAAKRCVANVVAVNGVAGL